MAIAFRTSLWVVRKDTRVDRAIIRVYPHRRELVTLLGDDLMYATSPIAQSAAGGSAHRCNRGLAGSVRFLTMT